VHSLVVQAKTCKAKAQAGSVLTAKNLLAPLSFYGISVTVQVTVRTLRNLSKLVAPHTDIFSRKRPDGE
jgi:hypothetical protein